ncbi:MAG: DUF6503 family protein [Maribacter dokdonensis]|uniref:DUF6503 family protein n=1 Tax=Maribacter dokdonensis TaxID=320912 RepID=UPI00329A0DA6
MNKSILYLLFSFFTLSGLFAFIAIGQETDHKSKQLINALKDINGGWQKLSSKKDVQFTYIYHDLAKGKDISTERYIFNGEISWGEYKRHEVNILPDSKGLVKQSKRNGKSTVSLNEEIVYSSEAINSADFFRSVNYFWFTMMYKLEDPGTIYKYLGQEIVNGVNYDKVSLTYDAKVIGKKVNDEFILFFNTETHLIDRFLFSLPAWGIEEPVLIMELNYEKIEDILIATNRKVYAPNKNGEYFTLGEFISKDIKFNNGYTIEDLKL